MNNYEVKNTQPIVMQDKGPMGSTRWKSKDGRYTAGRTLEKEDENPSYNPNKNKSSNYKSDNKLFDDRISDRLFRYVCAQLLYIPDLKQELQPGEEIFLINSNAYHDEVHGIDYQIGIRNKDRSQFRKVITVDLKTVKGALGSGYKQDKFYDQPSVFLDLYKKDGINDMWKPGGFLNENHRNSHYCFIVPKSEMTNEVITQKLNQEPAFLPDIDSVRMISCKRDTLQRYVNSRILQNEKVMQLCEDFKNGKAPEHSVVSIPVAGEDFSVELHFVDEGNGKQQIRLNFPCTPFFRKTIPCQFKGQKLT